MDYKRKKYLRQKLHIENIKLFYKFFIITQLQSANTIQWSFVSNELLKYNFKIKTFSVKLLKKSNFFLPDNLAQSCLMQNQNIYNGKIAIIYPAKMNKHDIKQALIFLESTSLFIPLFAFFDNRFLVPSQLKKVINASFDINALKITSFLLRYKVSLLSMIQLVNK